MTHHLFSTLPFSRHGRVTTKDGVTFEKVGTELGAVMPDFVASTTKGKLSFNDWAGDDWVYLFSHPAAFTPVCTSEIASVARHASDFAERDVKCLALTGDTVADLKDWADEIASLFGATVDFPHIADTDGELAKALGLRADAAPDGWCKRKSILIGPDKRIRSICDYPLSVGRSTAEVLRMIDALQMAEKLDVYMPEGWTEGAPMFLSHQADSADLSRRYGKNWEQMNDYMRYFPASKGSRLDKAIQSRDLGDFRANPLSPAKTDDNFEGLKTDATRILKLFSRHRNQTA